MAVSNGRGHHWSTWVLILFLALVLGWLSVLAVQAGRRGDLPCDQPYTPGHCGYETR